MNVQALLKRIASQTSKGDTQDVAALCHQVLKKEPKNFQAINYLGLALHNQKKHAEAVSIFKKALKINSQYSFVHNNLGCTYLELREYAEADLCFKRALRLSPDTPAYYANSGIALYQLRKYQEARLQCEHAIRLRPDFAQAMVYLGACLQHLGMLRESIEHHLTANDLDPHLSMVYVHLFNALSFSHITDDALQVAQAGLQVVATPSIEQLELLNGIAKIGWLSGQLDLARKAISESNTIPLDAVKKNTNFRNLIAYHKYLEKLLTLRDACPQLYAGEADKAMFFVGDSHCLSPSETMVVYGGVRCRILSTLIHGCKAFHLARPQNNVYKASLQVIMKALPPQSLVIIGFGEIDCRPDEGIFMADQEKGVDFRTSIPDFVERYVAFTETTAAQYHHRLIYYGVPASNPEIFANFPAEKTAMLKEIISLFNHELGQAARKRNREILDIYDLTSKSQALQDAEFHIDGFHLHPRTLGLLFEKHLFGT